MSCYSRKKCNAHWCGKELTDSNRTSISDIRVCRTCYAYVWEKSKKLKMSMLKTLKTIEGPKHHVASTAKQCERTGCNTTFNSENPRATRCMIGDKAVCKNCYQAAWAQSKLDKTSIKDALENLRIKDGESHNKWRKKELPKNEQ